MQELEETVKRDIYALPVPDNYKFVFLSGVLRATGEIGLQRDGYTLSLIGKDKRFFALIADLVGTFADEKPVAEELVTEEGTWYSLDFFPPVSNTLLTEAHIIHDKYEFCRNLPKSFFTPKARTFFLRGLFLGCGHLTVPRLIDEWAPEKSNEGYLLRFNLATDSIRDDIAELICMDGTVPRRACMKRSDRNDLYIKRAQSVCDVIGFMGSDNGYMRLSEIVTAREMKNKINRLNNCDLANIDKTVRTASKQIATVEGVMAAVPPDRLSAALRETCALRTEHPEATLEELGQMCHPPVTKNCVNLRMRRLATILTTYSERNKLSDTDDVDS